MTPFDGVLAGMRARQQMLRDDEDTVDRARKRKQEEQDRAFTLSERERSLKVRSEMAAVAAPAAMGQAEQAGPVDPESSNQAAAQPMPVLPTMQGKTYGTADEANAAAAAYNSPQSVASRQAAVLSAAGEVDSAQKVRSGAMQEQTAKYKLNEAERADIKGRFMAALGPVNTWQGLGDVASTTTPDGHGGYIKYRFAPSADGKTQIVNIVMPDGSLKPTDQSFENSQTGLFEAKQGLEQIPAKDQLAHLHQKAMLEQQAKRDANTAAYQEGLIGAKLDKNDIDAAKAGGSAFDKMPEQDKAVLLDLNKQLELINSERVKAQAGGMWQADAPGSLAIQKQEAMLMLRRSALLKRYQADQPVADPLNLRGGQGGGQGGGAATEQPARQPTMIDAVGEAMKRNGDGPNVRIELKNPTAPYTKTKAQADAENMGLVKTAAKSPGSGPTMLDKVTGAIRDQLNRNAETVRQMEAIRARVREADDGGKPLTAEERATARQFGFAPRT